MKFNININQIALANTRLDIADGAILDYLYYLCSSPSPKIQQNRIDGYTWVNYRHLMSEMPLLRIKAKGAITPRIQRIEKEGFIRTRKDKRRRIFVQLTGKIDSLFTKMNSTVHQNEHPTIHETEHYNNTKNNHNTKSNVEKQHVNKSMTNHEKGQLDYYLERLEDLKNRKFWLSAIKQLGFNKIIEIFIDVLESETAIDKRKCAVGLVKKAGYKSFLARTKSDPKL